MIRRALAAATVAVAVSSPAIARAQSADDLARADAFFGAAKQLRDAGLYADACPKFAESERLAPGIGVALYLADCYERTGRYANAWAEFRKAERLARERNDKRAEVARGRAEALEPKLNRLTIAVPQASDHAGWEVTLDGSRIPPEHWNMAMAADPGDHLLTVRAPGQALRTIHVHLDASAQATTVPIDEPKESPPAAAPSAPPSAEPAGEPAPSSPSTGGGGSGTRRWIGLAFLGAGVVGMGVGAAFLAIKNQSMSNGAPQCGPTHYNSDAGTASVIAFSAGGAAFLSALVLFLTSPGGGDKSAALQVTPAPMAAGGGAVIRGSF
jgi:hypothetical protein